MIDRAVVGFEMACAGHGLLFLALDHEVAIATSALIMIDRDKLASSSDKHNCVRTAFDA